MPVRVFLSHASADKPFVEELKLFLEDGGDIKCWLDKHEIDYGHSINAKIADGLASADYLLLILSATSVKSSWVEEEWTTAHWEQVNTGATKLIPVLLDDCEVPKILANKLFCDLRTNRLEEMRKLKTRLIPKESVALTAPTPNFIGRKFELEQLKQRLSQPGALVPIIGMPGVGKSYLAKEFLKRNRSMFEAVHELACGGKDLATLTGELATLLGLHLPDEPAKVAAQLRQHLARKNCLLVLDNVDDDQPSALVPGGNARVLVTAREGGIPFIADEPEVKPEVFTDAEALDLFRRIVGKFPEDAAVQLFRKLGHLPYAIAIAAGMVKHDVRYKVKEMADKLPALPKLTHGYHNVAKLFGDAIDALQAPERNLLQTLAVCAPAGTRLPFAAEVAAMDEPAALDALYELNRRNLVVELDRDERLYRLHPLMREAAIQGVQVGQAVSPAIEALRTRHAECVLKHLDWERAPLQSGVFLEEAEHAITSLPETTYLRVNVANNAGLTAMSLGRLAEAQRFLEQVERSASAADNKTWLQAVLGNQALILKAWGRLDDAMALHKKEEKICEELGDRAGLQASYGNQALILRAWGRLDDAMALHKKQEKICEELGDRASLQGNYGNQAVILQAWGRLDDAMLLHKKQEKICEERGDRASLQRSYGNQALILKDWGRLDDAMALHKKEEEICEELGDRAGLGRSYGNQALILQDWGRLDDATALHKKEEKMCQELGDRAGLAGCYGNMGFVLRLKKQKSAGDAKLREALAIFEELRMPRERDVVRKALGLE